MKRRPLTLPHLAYGVAMLGGWGAATTANYFFAGIVAGIGTAIILPASLFVCWRYL